ncbi:MAG: dihydrodipicolinate synthase family protein [Gemmatimonadetes bacterium]|jgi:dihydrodipicolinate synthase/N-acetylneuraminate lyase|nr:dihydrodipicolinate synthase family protein [Gemmatimonadota bacterium]MBT4504407.1 dihydrodipicolinate synthase family protein [Gemmatimonadota bacterium]MBT6145680.1 dihydrodipicolinate synthase family protein [Gemmatimonadota bacterium]MBT7863305.1 dihydrodipicolinate synthase family protein [Gemmatimonadota bacterium]
MLDRQTFTGPWAGLPVAWSEEDTFDEEVFQADVTRCCEAGIPGVYSGGTSGEFYAMELDEWQRVAACLIETCHQHGRPAMIGCTSTYTRGAMQRAQMAAEMGADAIQVALPFWMQVGEEQVVPFFRDVARVTDGLALSIYETTRAKKVLTLAQHKAIKDAVPGYVMVKANEGTIGCTAEGCEALSEFVNVFVSENRWAQLGPVGAAGCCSALVYWNPRFTLELWEHMRQGRWESLEAVEPQLRALGEFLAAQFAPRGFTDTAYDRMGGRAGGFLKTSLRNRAPYPSATLDDIERLQAWYEDHFPEMLQL